LYRLLQKWRKTETSSMFISDVWICNRERMNWQICVLQCRSMKVNIIDSNAKSWKDHCQESSMLTNKWSHLGQKSGLVDSNTGFTLESSWVWISSNTRWKWFQSHARIDCSTQSWLSHQIQIKKIIFDHFSH